MGANLTTPQISLPREELVRQRALPLRRRNLDLAYLLGAFAAHTEVGTPTTTRLSFASRESGQLELLAQPISRLLGTTPSSFTTQIGLHSYQRMTICHDRLSQHFFEVTKSNSQVPWEHLGSRQEFASYLRGLFDHGGSFQLNSAPGITLNKVNGEALLSDVSRVFLRLGIYPLLLPGELCSLKLLERSDWSRFKTEIGASLQTASDRLDTLTRIPSKINYYTVEDYEAVMTLGKTGTLRPSAIAAGTNVPVNSVRDWLNRGWKPRCVTRYLALQQIDADMPNGEVINLVYRRFGGSSLCARACGSQVTPETATARLASLAARDHGDDHAILSALQLSPRVN